MPTTRMLMGLAALVLLGGCQALNSGNFACVNGNPSGLYSNGTHAPTKTASGAYVCEW